MIGCMTGMTHTWDGLPMAEDFPRGSSIVVRRADGAYLVLHRALHGADYAGDWAWTPPSGARFPGEPILTGALRELAEESGITGIDPLPVDLSIGWALFSADVALDTPVRLDHEHDRYEWLPLDDAVKRCAPEAVQMNLRRAAAIPPCRIGFRPLTWEDLPDMVAWQHTPHARRWFVEDLDLDSAARKYGPRIDGMHHIRVDVVLIDDEPCGFVQHYLVADEPEYDTATGMPDAAGIDYLLSAHAGQGLGARVIWSYLRDVMLPAFPQLTHVVASPEPANEQSLRALEKAGFQRSHEITTTSGTQLLCVLDVARVFGRRSPA